MIDIGYPIQLVRSSRKTVAIQITRQGEVIVRSPRQCPQSLIDEFVSEKRPWIEQKMKEMKHNSFQPLHTPEEEQVYRAQAAEIFARKASYYAERMGVTYQRIAIRDQKTRWGSCSGKGNLNFNWRLVLAPAPVLDYVVIHELAHRREMNHSSRFWRIVEEIMPDYRTHRRWLRDHGDSLMR